MTIEMLLDEYTKLAGSMYEQGHLFEMLVKRFLTLDPICTNRFDTVWLWNEFPYRNNRPDTGIDLVALERTGSFCAIQCKFFAPEHTISKPDIDSFITATGKSFTVGDHEIFFNNALIISTTDKWGKNAEDAIKGQLIPVERKGLRDFIDNDSIDWSEFSINNPESIRVAKKKKALRRHQLEALSSVLSGFEQNDRGKLIMACGTGKTFTALKIAEALGNGIILFLAPSISLLSQTIKEWLGESDSYIGCIPVCSDAKVGGKADNDDIALTDLVFPASTDVEKVSARFRALRGKCDMTVVFSTYQSIKVVSEAQTELGIEFDLIICDEAHRTTGVTLDGADDSAFVKVHDNNFIKAKKRLYMTATPRVYSDGIKQKADEENALLVSMDDEEKFGPEFYYLGFGKAVEEGLLSDYKVLILTVSENYIETGFQSQLADSNNELTLEDTAKLVGCWNALSKRNTGYFEELAYNIDPQPMKRAVAFNATIKMSENIASRMIAIQSGNTDETLITLETDHVSGKENSLSRNKKLAWLKAQTNDGVCRILSNARCLSEGVDVPSLDAVIFLSPRNSVVDVVQSVGRVMRRSEGKKYGYIILPVVVPTGIAPEEALNDNIRYRVVWDVLQALRAHDDRFNHTINTLELNKQQCMAISVIGVDCFENSVPPPNGTLTTYSLKA